MLSNKERSFDFLLAIFHICQNQVAYFTEFDAVGPKVRGFKPGRGRWLFNGHTIRKKYFLRRGNKAVGPTS
jgi:hypothetical protein